MTFNNRVQQLLQEMKCWKGYKKVGTKKGLAGKGVNNCVKK
jgi:hypothetical protein